jgi:hypothetical protein
VAIPSGTWDEINKWGNENTKKEKFKNKGFTWFYMI